ncbi:MAG: response regulator transcription factor [Burkholderiaceae bacterium]|nr:response regulator transcription factor [Burkholderiaceae bacterium]MCD6674595.1 response regulator [Burkholderiaceae bacterium]
MTNTATDTVLVLLVDDEPGVTDALAWLLESVRIPSRAFASARDFLRALDEIDGPVCAVLDLRMPEMSGLELQQRLIEAGHDVPVMFLSAHGDVPAAVNAMQAGAVDFLQKPLNPQAFLTSVNRIIRLARERYARREHERELQRELRSLSSREIDVLEGLRRGHTSKEIARALEISPKTVDVHRANILRKMKVSSAAELIRRLGTTGSRTAA